jgi:hypothetical protein
MHAGFWSLPLLLLKMEALRIFETSLIQPTRRYDAEARFPLVLFPLGG